MKKLMSKIKFNKKICITLIYIFLLMGSISFAIFPETNAIFIKDKLDTPVLAYTTDLDRLAETNLEYTFIKSGSNKDNIRLKVLFNRDSRYKNEDGTYEGESYTITAKNNNHDCTVITGSRSSNLNIDANNKITFNESSSNTTGSIDIVCPVIENENISVNTAIRESVKEEEDFPYASATYSHNYNDYRKLFIEILDGNKIFKDSVNAYEELMAIVGNYMNNDKDYAVKYNVNDRKIYESYINHFGINNTTDVLSKDFKSVIGINKYELSSSECDNKGECYGFTFDENFVGYVKTYDWYVKNPASKNVQMYFSTSKPSEIKTSLEYYIETYDYKNPEDSKLMIQFISKYLSDNKKEYTIDNLKDIPNILTYTNPTSGYPYLSFNLDALDYAYNYLNLEKNDKVIRISHNQRALMSDVFLYFLNSLDIDNLTKTSIKDNFSDAIYDNIYDAITCTKNCEEYTEILYYDNGNDKNEYVLFKITYDGTYNYVSVTSLLKDLSPSVVESVNSSMSNNYLNEALICTEDCNDYFEVHYDSKNHEFLLLTVQKNSNQITVSSLLKLSEDETTVDITEDNIETINNLILMYDNNSMIELMAFALKDDDVESVYYATYLENILIPYLENYFRLEKLDIEDIDNKYLIKYISFEEKQ